MTDHSSPIRARYGVSVVSLKSDLCSAAVFKVSIVIWWKLDHVITALDCMYLPVDNVDNSVNWSIFCLYCAHAHSILLNNVLQEYSSELDNSGWNWSVSVSSFWFGIVTSSKLPDRDGVLWGSGAEFFLHPWNPMCHCLTYCCHSLLDLPDCLSVYIQHSRVPFTYMV